MAITIPDAAVLKAAKRRDWERAQESYFSGRFQISHMFADYIQGVGIYDDFTLHLIRRKLNELAVQEGLITPDGSVFDSAARLKAEYVQVVCNHLGASYYNLVPPELISSHIVLAQSSNENCDLALPPNKSMVAQKGTRPAVRIYSTTGCDLYLHPFCYQMIWNEKNWFCPSASNRSLSKLALIEQIKSADVQQTSRDVVIVQDRFPGSNFSHFLFDWVTRIGLIRNSGIVEPSNCLFAMGGAPGQFELIVLKAISDEYGLSEDQFLFPTNGILLRSNSKILWFSDQVETYLHPAQMAHPQSVGILRNIAARLRPTTKPRFSRIYVSRMDASRRRVTNEAEIVRALGEFDFEPVVLADFTVDQQLALVTGADIIVAPHGMGLTHVSLHPGTPTLIELHHPTVGTDAYALMAKAMGFPYLFVVGQPSSGSFDDFAVPLQELLSALGRLGLTGKDGRLPSRPGRTLIVPVGPRSTGLQNTPECLVPTSSAPESPFNPPSPVLCHVREDPEIAPDSNVGAWTNISIDEGRLYTASCWIWIPQDFRGVSIDLNIGEWPKQRRRAADLNSREQWQQLTASVTCPPGAKPCNVVLRLGSRKGEYVYSTNWQIEGGVGPPDKLPEEHKNRD